MKVKASSVSILLDSSYFPSL